MKAPGSPIRRGSRFGGINSTSIGAECRKGRGRSSPSALAVSRGQKDVHSTSSH